MNAYLLLIAAQDTPEDVSGKGWALIAIVALLLLLAGSGGGKGKK